MASVVVPNLILFVAMLAGTVSAIVLLMRRRRHL